MEDNKVIDEIKNNIKIVFIGTPKFGAIILGKILDGGVKPSLVITSPDKPVGRRQVLTPPPVKEVALRYKIPFVQPEKINSALQRIKDINPDLILVASFGQVISKEILNLPKFGSLNIHPSLLPKYRGPSPIQQVIIDGEKEAGVTIMKMIERVDAGPIITQRKIDIGNLGYRRLEEKLALLGANLLIKTLPDWIEGKIKPRGQDEEKATYTRIVKKEDGRIDWSEHAKLIERKMKAFEEWPKIYIILEGEPQKEVKGGPKGEFGKIYLAPNDKIAIQCKNSYFIVKKIKPEGKKEMRIEDFLKGHMDIIGKKFE